MKYKLNLELDVDITEEQSRLINKNMVRVFKNSADYFVRIGKRDEAELMATIGRKMTTIFKDKSVYGH
jgi:hypothetical protein